MRSRKTGCPPALICMLLGLAGGAAAGAAVFPPPVIIPQFQPPQFLPGLEPIPPDEFGLSPLGRFLVLQEEARLRILGASDGRTVFLTRSFDRLDAGFDPLDRRLYLLEGSPIFHRLRFVDLSTGTVLLNESTSERPEIRLNFAATANLLAARSRFQTEVLLFNRNGTVTHRAAFTPLVQWGFSPAGSAVAFLDPGRLGRTEVRLVNAATGVPTLRTAALVPFTAGFAPFSPVFVLAQATSRDSFRVVMVDAMTGRTLLFRTFFGPVNAAFTPNGALLAVRTRLGLTPRTLLFRTADGGQAAGP